MNKKKSISLLVAAILPLTSPLGIAESENISEDVFLNQSTEDNISEAESRFGLSSADSKIEVRYDDLYLLNLLIDKENFFFLLEVGGYSMGDYILKNLVTKERFCIVGGNSRISFYDGFDKKHKILLNGDAFLSNLLLNKSGKEVNFEQFFINNFPDGNITLGELADLLPRDKNYVISDYRLNLAHLEDYEYNNTVPSNNDELFVKRSEFCFVASKNNKEETTKYMFLTGIGWDENSKKYIYRELFDGEKIIEYSPKDYIIRFIKNNSFNITNQKNLYNYMTDYENIEEINPIYYRLLNENTVIIDGEEYYNIGMLRKLYENIPLENRYDYSHKLGIKPGSKDFKIDYENNVLYAVDKPRVKELTKES